MGGKGEMVSYKRIRAATKKQRQDLKKAISNIVDQTSDAITVIVLVDNAAAGGSTKGRGKKSGS